jgi:hypothetical protein
MSNREFEKLDTQYTANIIAELYSHKKIQDFIPILNRGNRNNKSGNGLLIDEISYMFVNDEYSHIQGKESLELLLKKTIHANVPSRTELTPNGIMRDELKKGIDILRAHINNVSANNKNGNLDAELTKRKKELEILEQKYEECLKNGNFEVVTNYKVIAFQALKLLSSATTDLKYRKDNRIRTLTDMEKKAKELYELIHQKFGLEVDKRERWQIEKENKVYEYKNPEEREREEHEKEQYEKEYNKQRDTPKEYYKNFIDHRDPNQDHKNFGERKYNRYQNRDQTQKNFSDRKHNDGYKPKSKYTPPHMKDGDANVTKDDQKTNQYVPPHKKKEEEKLEIKNEVKFPTLENLEQKSNIVSSDSCAVGAWGKKLDFKALKTKSEPAKGGGSQTKKCSKNETKENDEENEWGVDE